MAKLEDLIKMARSKKDVCEKRKEELDAAEKNKNEANEIKAGYDKIEKRTDEKIKNQAEIISNDQTPKKIKLSKLLDKIKEHKNKIKKAAVIVALCSIFVTGAIKDTEPLMKPIEPTYISVGGSRESSDDMEEYAVDSEEMDEAVEVEPASEQEDVPVSKENDIEEASDKELDVMLDQTGPSQPSVDDNEKEDDGMVK